MITFGRPVVRQNSVTPNDFTLPVLYSLLVPGDNEPSLYRVTVREGDTSARLAALRVADAVSFSPRAAFGSA